MFNLFFWHFWLYHCQFWQLDLLKVEGKTLSFSWRAAQRQAWNNSKLSLQPSKGQTLKIGSGKVKSAKKIGWTLCLADVLGRIQLFRAKPIFGGLYGLVNLLWGCFFLPNHWFLTLCNFGLFSLNLVLGYHFIRKSFNFGFFYQFWSLL